MSQNDHFACDHCGKEHRWREQFAGKRVKCGCGHVMTAPPHPTQKGDLYDLAPNLDSASPSPRHLTPVSAPLASASPGLDYQRVDTRTDETNLSYPDPVKDLYLPLALIGGGTVIEMALGLFAAKGQVDAAMRSVMYVGIYMILNTILMLIAIYFVAWMREISFGSVQTAILKLCAISIGPGAIAGLLGAMFWFVPLVRLITWIIEFVLYFALLGALFDLDESDTWWCVLTVFLVKLLFVFVSIGILRSM